MGHRANFIWKENGKVTIRYSGWKAQSAHALAAQGPKYCKKFFRWYSIEPYIMDNAFAEGGILVDADAKTIYVHGGADTAYSTFERNLFIEKLHNNFRGWKYEWAYGANYFFGLYLNLKYSEKLKLWCLLNNFDLDIFAYDENYNDSQEIVICVINKDSTLVDYAFSDQVEMDALLGKGEKMLDLIDPRFKIKTWQKENFTYGFAIIDIPLKKLIVCFANDEVDFRQKELLESRWPGWTMEYNFDTLKYIFNYTNRDPSPILLTEEEKQTYFNQMVKWGKNENPFKV